MDKTLNTGQRELPRKEFGIDPLMVLRLLKKNWYWFVLGLVIAFLGARFYIGHTMPVYRVSSTILINEGDGRTIGANEQFLQGMGLPGGMRNMDNQILILKSRGLTEQALAELPYEVEYYRRTIRNKIPFYPDSPAKVIFKNDIILPKDIEFSINSIDGETFSLKSESDNFSFSKTGYFGDTIDYKGANFTILCYNPEWFISSENSLYFNIRSKTSLINYFNSRISVELLSRSGTVLEVSMKGTNRSRDVDFINKLLEVFQNISVNKKNLEAIRRIQFIDEQIVGVSDSLQITGNRLQQFRSANRVMDISAQGQSIIDQLTQLENERARLNLEADYYDYLADYLSKDVSGEMPIVPISMGINDPGLTRLVTNLAELQSQLLDEGLGEKNPMQGLLEQRIQSTKDALLETLNGLRRANSLAKTDNQKQIASVNANASALPATERQLLGIERKFRLNDELYTFLLETRAKQQMQKASNTADSEIIDYADESFSEIVSPNRMMVNLIALLGGSGIPFLVIFLNSVFKKQIREEEISEITDLPMVGNIPRNSEKLNTVVFEYPNSAIAEAYRMLRSKMQFFNRDNKATVTLITSSMPKDGKTFTAINLASVYSLLGKKTVLVGFDLRKPGIYDDFNLENTKGVSSWLIGNNSVEEIIQKTDFENLSVITAGPVPPNPSELAALDKTRELVKELRERYEHIIIDSSPIGFISDALQLAKIADVCLLVIRPGKTRRDMLFNTLREIRYNGINEVSVVINDIKSAQKLYGDKYGYTKNKKNSRWIPSNKKKVSQNKNHS